MAEVKAAVKEERTELVCILDKSGSMCGYESDTIGGFNAMIEAQRKLSGSCRVTTILFDDRVSLLHNRCDISEMKGMTEADYQPGGCTAMLDAIGLGIKHMVKHVRQLKEEARPDHVIFFITTDGMENASRSFSKREVKKMIEHEKEKYGWKFIFSGADIDVEEIAEDLSIDDDMAFEFTKQDGGVRCCMAEASDRVYRIREARLKERNR